MTDLSKISVVLPSLDPDEKLTATINGLLEHGFTDIILINDGSKEKNLHYFTDAAAAHPEITLLHHAVNRGKGAALKTAFNWFLVNRPHSLGVVTADGDGQHHPEDTRACAQHLLETGRLTLGVRDFTQPGIPARSSFGNKTTSGVFKVFVGMTISDTQTGLRAISRKDLKTLLPIEGDRFEYETNMLLALKHHSIPFDEVKIRTVYIEENASSHFHPIRDSWRIYKLILAHFFRYTLVSVSSAVIDNGLYALLSALLYGAQLLTGPALTVASTVGARAVSSLFNFYMNKNVTFRSKTGTAGALVRYYALALPLLAAQALLTQGVYSLLQISESQVGLRTLIYAIVMTVLYIASFVIQQRWVFAPNKKKEEKSDVC